MNLKSLLSNVEPTAKVAAAEPPKPTEKTAAAPSQALSSSLNAAISAIGTTKVASAPEAPSGAVAEVAKLAGSVIGMSKQADEQYMQHLADVFADRFVSRLGEHKAAADSLNAKTASEMGITAEEIALVKLSRENPAQFLADVQRGMEDGQRGSEKSAAETYQETYNGVVVGIHKTAAAHYAHGYEVADVVLREAAA
jgi:hypothetical protein